VDWPLVILFGFLVGILVGTTGVGGGSLMTPALILVFGTAPTTAIGTDLAYAAVTKTVGGWRHWRSGTVDMTIALWLAVGSIPGALGTVLLAAGLALLKKAGLDFPVSVIFLVPVVVALGLTALHFGRERAARMRAQLPLGEHTHPPTPESA
jgi:uncharacterized membrane protein YfcA